MTLQRVSRRDLVALLGSAAALAATQAARAQQASKVIRIGFLGASLRAPPPMANYRAFLTRLRELGFSEGKNLVVEHRSTDDPRGISAAGAELMQLQPDLIVATGPEASLRAVIATNHAIPIVMMATNFDPIARGYVATLARPGGNITGVAYRQLELAAKQVELLKQAFPEATRMAALFDVQTADQFDAAKKTAELMGLELQAVKLDNPPYDFDAAFRVAAENAAQMVLVLSSPSFIAHRSRIAELGIAHGLPTMFIFKAYVEAGGLMSYGADFPMMYRRVAEYVAGILRGAKPADLPVDQAAKFELVVNLKTAKAIGVALPTAILLRADEVIE